MADPSWRTFFVLGRAAADGWATLDAAWGEYDPTPLMGKSYPFAAAGVIIAEPCNTVSNFAVLRSVVEIL
jgi:hypothetical protein